MTRSNTLIMALLALTLVGLAGPGPASAVADDTAANLCPPPLARLIAGNVGRFLVMRSELNITDEQRKEIRARLKSHRSEIQTVIKSLMDKRKALRETVLNKAGDETSIRAASADLAKSIGDAAVLASKVIAEIRPTLTPDQLNRVQEFRAGCAKATSTWLTQMGK